MLPVALFAAVALLLIQPSDANGLTQRLNEQTGLLEAEVIAARGEADDDSSSDTPDLKDRVRQQGLPQTIGYLLYNMVATPFAWMWNVLLLPLNFVKTIIYAWNIYKENKADSKS